MVSINVTPGQNGEIPAWRAKGKYTFPVLVVDASDYARVNYSVSGTPTNLLLNADGKMVFRHIGYGPGAERTMEAEIRELLGLDPFEGLEATKRAEETKKDS
ncbi:MAG: hypothetical protein LAP85_25850 [Acidobacteriia bacterium]|nr:hypothetical protein [Terriglobia bacterium]